MSNEISFSKLVYFVFLLVFIFQSSCKKIVIPQPIGALPSARQLEWHKMDYYAFVHFNINTFSDLEWGHGNEDPSIFDPSNLDCRQWAKVCRDAGMEGIIITAKHHDGFCLWPSAFTEHSVKNSPWRGGKGDLLKELSDACKEFGLKMGVYMSPWDRNNPLYGTDEYNNYFINQLTEALTNYGEIFEVWFDGANGEGPNGKKQIYDWDGFIATVRKHQPNAVIFSDAGPDVRWIGNERGFAKETNWCTLYRDNYYPGTPNYHELTEGNKNGTHWLPGEVNVSIRPGWYYHKDQDDDVKSVDQLEMIYYQSVGRNGNFLLNLPVDRRGLVHENEIEELNKLKNRLDNTFSEPVPFKIPVSLAFTTSYLNVGEPTKYLLDEDLNTFWSSREDVTRASFELELDKGQKANVLEISEYIPLGQRVEAFEIDALLKGRWKRIAQGTTIGWKRLVKLPNVDCQRYRVNISKTMATPVISNIKLFYAPHDNYLIEATYDFNQRMNWWRNDRFGMLIRLKRSAAASQAKGDKGILYKQFDPDYWVKQAKATGAKYIIVTAKNSDGFCFWDSDFTDYKIDDTSGDLLKGLSETCKKEGIKLGFYYSIIDEHHPDAQTIRTETGKESNPNFQKYVEEFLKPQIKELIEKYDPAILWFDGEMNEVWTHKNGLDLYQFTRSLKPEIIINNRVDKGRFEKNGMTKEDQPYAGDFGTPIRRIQDESNVDQDWELSISLSDMLDSRLLENQNKSPENLIHELVDATSKGGNVLLDVFFKNKWTFSNEDTNLLNEIGEWLDVNGEAIYGARPSEILTENKNIRYTQKGEKWLYVIGLMPLTNEVIVKNVLPKKGSKMYLLGYKDPLEWKLNSSNQLIISIPESLNEYSKPPYKYAWTLKIVIEN